MSRDNKLAVWWVVVTVLITVGIYANMDGRGLMSFAAALLIAALVSAMIVGGASLGLDAERKLRE
jgi:uncharacterized protein (DUF58 family)